MKTTWKAIVLVAFTAAVAGIIAMKHGGTQPASMAAPVAINPTTDMSEPSADQNRSDPLPTLISLGAGKCIPCKAMEPIRNELKAEYDGRLKLIYHDVWQDSAASEHYRIRLIPTLIYLDAAGHELGRTEGYVTKAQILAAFREWGVNLDTTSSAESGS
jgi:thioredoxin 1